jgi:hypothetical protein
MPKAIEVVVSPTGETTVQTTGFKGKSCQDATRELERALGTVTKDVKSAEYYQTESTGLQARQ